MCVLDVNRLFLTKDLTWKEVVADSFKLKYHTVFNLVFPKPPVQDKVAHGVGVTSYAPVRLPSRKSQAVHIKELINRSCHLATQMVSGPNPKMTS